MLSPSMYISLELTVCKCAFQQAHYLRPLDKSTLKYAVYSIAIFAEVYRPNDVRMAMDLHYYYGHCNTPEAQAQIKQNFIQILNVSMFSEVCQDPSFKEKCIAENVKVTCSEVEFVISRKKHSAGEVNPYWVYI